MELLRLKAPLRIKPYLELYLWRDADRVQHLHHSNAANLHQEQTSKCAFNYHIGHMLSVMIQKHSSSQGTEAEGKKAVDFRTT